MVLVESYRGVPGTRFRGAGVCQILCGVWLWDQLFGLLWLWGRGERKRYVWPMSVKTSLSDRYSSHFSFNFMSLLEEMQIYPVLFEKWTSALCMWFFTVLHIFLGFRNPGFISKCPGRPGFLSVHWSLWSSLSHKRKFFFHVSLRLGLSNDCLLGSSGSLHTENTDSSSVCSQSEYFLLWGLQKAFTLLYSKRLSLMGVVIWWSSLRGVKSWKLFHVIVQSSLNHGNV